MNANGSPTVRRGAGREDIVSMLTRDYRLWAKLPADVQCLMVLGAPGGTDGESMLAAVPRPPAIEGVCASCGCTEDDPCLTSHGPCAWIDDSRRKCSGCDVPMVMRRGPGGQDEREYRRRSKRGGHARQRRQRS